MRDISVRKIQPDTWEVWSHVTDGGSDYHERIGSIVKFAPRGYLPSTQTRRLESVDSRNAAVAVLMGAYAAGETAYRP